MYVHNGTARLCIGLTCTFFFVSNLVAQPANQPVGIYLSKADDLAGVVYKTCMRNDTSNNGGPSNTFKQNLSSALRNLLTRASAGSKNGTASVGSGQDRVYAAFQCRGDQTTPGCLDCMSNVTTTLSTSICPTSIGARIQLDRCYLRYDNSSFFTLDVTYAIGYCYGKSSDLIILKAIASLVQNVTSLAPKNGGFASASAAGEYAAAQCMGYLNESTCSACLTAVPYRTLCDSSLGEQVHLTSCYYRFEPYSFLDTASPPLPPSPTPASLPPTSGSTPFPSSKKDSKTGVILGVAAAVVFAIGALCLGMLWRQKKHSQRQGRLAPKEFDDGWHLVQPKAKLFSLHEVEAATRNFHPDNKLGEGGFGPVYKGTLSNGQDIAVKKLSPQSHQGKKEFINEVNLITSVQHKNLIKLLGSCVTRYERILVYEYLPNKSVGDLLFGGIEGRMLDWPTRYGIVLGLAQGLSYLHEESQVRIIHRDIKPSNILLDDQLNPIIADFGLARLVRDEESHINTKIAGTLGYLAPEYAVHGEFTEKVDVFSFGVVTLEVVSGKRNSSAQILGRAWRMFLDDKQLELMDPKLCDCFSSEQGLRIIHVALLCTQEIPRLRPSMSRVVSWLSENVAISEVPSKPPFVELGESQVFANYTNHHLRNSSSVSSNNPPAFQQASTVPLSMSEVEPR